MIRRILSILLILLVLVQSTPLEHSHAGTDLPSDHDQRPHIHFPFFWIFTSHNHSIAEEERPHRHHGHSHGGGHQHHHHDADVPDEEPSQPNEQPVPADDHDSNSFYFPHVVMCSSSTGPQQEKSRLSASLPKWMPGCFGFVQSHSADVQRAMPPPVAGRYHFPIHLDFLALLI